MEQKSCVAMVSGLRIVQERKAQRRPGEKADLVVQVSVPVLGVAYDPAATPGKVAGSVVYLIRGEDGRLQAIPQDRARIA